MKKVGVVRTEIEKRGLSPETPSFPTAFLNFYARREGKKRREKKFKKAVEKHGRTWAIAALPILISAVRDLPIIQGRWVFKEKKGV